VCLNAVSVKYKLVSCTPLLLLVFAKIVFLLIFLPFVINLCNVIVHLGVVITLYLGNANFGLLV